VSIDDSSVSRHPELGIRVARESSSPPTEWDVAAWRIEETDYRGTSYFARMPPGAEEAPRIGYHAISGGGGLLAADVLKRHGLELADFAETSGNPPASKVYRIAKLVLSQREVAGYCLMGAVLANQDQTHHAHGLARAFREELASPEGFPVVVLLAGNREREALAVLREELERLPVEFALFGREHLHKLDEVASRMKELVDRYRSKGPPPRGRAGEPARPESAEAYAFRTGRVLVDRPRCAGCASLACVKACSLYGGYLYRVRDGVMVSAVDEENWPRRCTECLACEHECRLRGQGALTIELPTELPGNP
jgi:succinyl-CoA synthetase beta subunit